MLLRKENAKQITECLKTSELRAIQMREEVVGQCIKADASEVNAKILITEGSLEDSRDRNADDGQA